MRGHPGVRSRTKRGITKVNRAEKCVLQRTRRAKGTPYRSDGHSDQVVWGVGDPQELFFEFVFHSAQSLQITCDLAQNSKFKSQKNAVKWSPKIGEFVLRAVYRTSKLWRQSHDNNRVSVDDTTSTHLKSTFTQRNVLRQEGSHTIIQAKPCCQLSLGNRQWCKITEISEDASAWPGWVIIVQYSGF